MESLEKLISNDKLFSSGFFSIDLYDEQLKEVNEYISLWANYLALSF